MVRVYDTDVTNWDYSSNYYWQYIDQDRLDQPETKDHNECRTDHGRDVANESHPPILPCPRSSGAT